MTIDKIRHYMSEHLFNHWTQTVVSHQSAKELISNAINELESGLKNGSIPNKVEYQAELNLLKYLNR